MTLMALLTAVALHALSPQAPATPPPPPDCKAAIHRQFDFWLGEWDVVPSGQTPPPRQQPSLNVIQSAHGGCVLVENWTASTGGTGVYTRRK
jgi:hypothetical protein